MKKLLLLIFTAFSLSASAQKPKVDSIKPEPNYFLIGKLQDFKLLFAAIATPGDVTPNQSKAILDWINNGLTKIKADTATNKK